MQVRGRGSEVAVGRKVAVGPISPGTRTRMRHWGDTLSHCPSRCSSRRVLWSAGTVARVQVGSAYYGDAQWFVLDAGL